TLEQRASDTSALRSGIFWGGLAVAAIGVGVGAAGLARHDGRDLFCAPAERCPARGFVRSGYDAATGVNRGVLLLPLGLALIGAGAVWALSVELFGDDRSIPWWQIVA